MPSHVDVFKTNVRIRSMAKVLAILASHRREKYLVLTTIWICNVCQVNSSNLIGVSSLPQKVGKNVRKKSRKKWEYGKNFKEDLKLKVLFNALNELCKQTIPLLDEFWFQTSFKKHPKLWWGGRGEGEGEGEFWTFSTLLPFSLMLQ